MTPSELMFCVQQKKYLYNTRDAKGEGIVVEVPPKEYNANQCSGDICSFCGKVIHLCIPIKNVVSSNFTDFQALGHSNVLCVDCAKACAFFRYNLIADNTGMRLYNIREMSVQIQQKQSPPFLCIVTISQKKHIFYGAVVNENSKDFVCRFETENIRMNIDVVRKDFLFIGSLQALGESKQAISSGEVHMNILKQFRYLLVKYIDDCLKRRSFHVPLHLSQKLCIDEEQATKNILEVLS